MKIVESKFEEIKEQSLLKKIELAGRTCYKSENLITENSAVDFVKRIMSYNHGSVLEHAYLVFEVLYDSIFDYIKSLNNQFIHLTEVNGRKLMSMNFRTLYNLYIDKTRSLSGWGDLFMYVKDLFPDLFGGKSESIYNKDYRLLSFDEVSNLTEEEKDVHLYISVRFTCDRGVSHELVRHRLASFSQESTRYCNYSKDKFSNEITVIEPENLTEQQKEIWIKSMKEAEKKYFEMLKAGAQPQQARSVLPNSLKTEIVTTCNLKEWKLIFDLRCSEKAHPDIRKIMIPTREYFKEQGYIK